MLRRLGIAVAAVLTLGVASSASASISAHAVPPSPPAMAAALADQLNITVGQAQVNLAAQAQAGDIVERAQRALGASYAGLWFDNQTGLFHLNRTPGTPAAAVQAVADAAGIDAVVDVVPHRLSTLQAVADATGGGVDPKADKVVYEDRVATAATCVHPYCDAPIRGGVGIQWYNQAAHCTLGFTVHQASGGSPVDLTAGHCLSTTNAKYPIYTQSTTGVVCQLGQTDLGHVTTAYDAGLISELGRTCAGDAGYIVAWGNVENYGLSGVSQAYVGLALCHFGAYVPNGYGCGNVYLANVTTTISYGGTIGNVAVQHTDKFCAPWAPGDSGGPTAANNRAYGILVGGSTSSSCGGGPASVDDEINIIFQAMGLY